MMTAKKKHCERPRSCDDLVDLLMSDLMIEHLAILAHMTEDEFELFYDEVAGSAWTSKNSICGPEMTACFSPACFPSPTTTRSRTRRG